MQRVQDLNFTFRCQHDFKTARQELQTHQQIFDTFLNTSNIKTHLKGTSLVDLDYKARRKFSPLTRRVLLSNAAELLDTKTRDDIEALYKTDYKEFELDFKDFINNAVMVICRQLYGKKYSMEATSIDLYDNFFASFTPSHYARNDLAASLFGKVTVSIEGNTRNLNIYHKLNTFLLTSKFPWKIDNIQSVIYKPFTFRVRVVSEYGFNNSKYVHANQVEFADAIHDLLTYYTGVKRVMTNKTIFFSKRGFFQIQILVHDPVAFAEDFNSTSWPDSIWEGSEPWVEKTGDMFDGKPEEICYYPEVLLMKQTY